MMQVAFIQTNLNFLENSNIEITNITYSSYSVIEDSKISLNMEVLENYGSSEIETVPYTKFICIFSLLDFYVDKRISVYINNHELDKALTYKEKYKKLKNNQSTASDKILTEIYRLAVFIRNNITHRIENVLFSETSIKVTYNLEILEMPKSVLNIFYGIINIYLRHNQHINHVYILGILGKLFNDLKRGITSFKDNYNQPLENVSIDYLLDENRNIHTNVRYKIEGDQITFTNLSLRSDYRATDLPIILDNIEYLIPQESLDEQNSISLEKIRDHWKYCLNLPSLETLYSNLKTDA
ncbi:hypothetical protein [Acinetobacter sp. NS-4]|uniref:hypothetical protein n=1 Tax=Acinetobacter sp. NS-4 TaxID=3127956 RepID=UPI00307D71A2